MDVFLNYLILAISALMLLAVGIGCVVVWMFKTQKELHAASDEIRMLRKRHHDNEIKIQEKEEILRNLQIRMEKEREDARIQLAEAERKFKESLDENYITSEKLNRQKRVLEDEVLKLKETIKQFQNNKGGGYDSGQISDFPKGLS